MNDDVKWLDRDYLLTWYKTQPCMQPFCQLHRSVCPGFHKHRDRRRPPGTYRYSAKVCPNVYLGNSWDRPTNCSAGDNCNFCHTVAEFLYHPAMYKSYKCTNAKLNQYCPRQHFCAFYHGNPKIQRTPSPVNTPGSSPGHYFSLWPDPNKLSSSNSGNPDADNGFRQPDTTSPRLWWY